MKNSKKAVAAQELTRDHGRSFGAILVEHGRLTPDEAAEIQNFASVNGLRFGDAALQLNYLKQADVEFALARQFNYPVLPRGGPGGVSDDVVSGYSPQSELVEPLRAIRSRLLLNGFNNNGRNILAVTSPGRAEGRSWFAANLATVFAQVGERTLLIDADLRHPRQHELFNLNADVGLAEILTGRAGKEIISRIHPQLRLFVLPAGRQPPNPQELLTRPVFELILDLFSEQYDVVVIDTPSIAESADAQMLAARAGAAVMLARRDVTRSAQLTEAMRGFKETGINLVGTVFNEF